MLQGLQKPPPLMLQPPKSKREDFLTEQEATLKVVISLESITVQIPTKTLSFTQSHIYRSHLAWSQILLESVFVFQENHRQLNSRTDGGGETAKNPRGKKKKKKLLHFSSLVATITSRLMLHICIITHGWITFTNCIWVKSFIIFSVSHLQYITPSPVQYIHQLH